MTEFMRIKDTWLELAFVTLRKEQKEIALLATIDLGPQEYFERISEHIKKREKRGRPATTRLTKQSAPCAASQRFAGARG